jgi:POT family proton-dependent oligopeptide transporter
MTTPTREPHDLFGHPRGLGFLFATEMWERFSYYGMRALLVLYMVNYLLLPGNADGVVGYATLRSGFEALFGPLGVQPLASHIYGLYTALVYLTPVLGGLLADRWLGRRRTVILGASLMALGHFMMAVEQLFLLALLALILGNGAFKPNISTQVGALYAPNDARRDRAYSIFYVGINLGAFLAPLVCGTLGEGVGWHYGFSAAGVGMVIGLLVYLRGQRYLPAQDRAPARDQTFEAETMRSARGGIVALLVLALPVTLFWATYEQSGNTIALWDDSFTDRRVDLLVWAGEIPVTWFQAINPFLIFTLTPLVIALWAGQAARGREPSTVGKMAIGCIGIAAANLVLAAAALGLDGGKAGWLWLIAYFVLLTLGELYVSPIGLSLVSKIAPSGLLSMMMGAWFLTVFFGALLGGWLGSLWEGMDKGGFFLLIAALAGGAGLAIAAAAPPLRRLLGEVQ